MSWHVAASLTACLLEYNRLFPNRSKASDGGIGNPSHQATKSDHNPDYSAGGVVRAYDLTTTFLTAAQRRVMVDDLIATERANPVDRIWYLIHKLPGRQPHMWSRTNDWKPIAYHGPSPHDHHLHISLMHTKAAEHDTKPFFTSLGTPTSSKKDDDVSAADVFKEDVIENVFTGNPANKTVTIGTALVATYKKLDAVEKKLDKLLAKRT